MRLRKLILGCAVVLMSSFANAADIKTNFLATSNIISIDSTDTAAISALKVKYADMLDIMPTSLTNISLLVNLDDWYGTRYMFGGTTKRGIDCSAFTRVMYKSIYGLDLPRTAREQYSFCRKISAVELKEGDLLFFNTRGGVSHVGIYLRNNKFAHASSSNGVTVSDLYETYYLARFIGAGRIENNKSSEEAIYTKLLG